jgi:hypothetical protein
MRHPSFRRPTLRGAIAWYTPSIYAAHTPPWCVVDPASGNYRPAGRNCRCKPPAVRLKVYYVVPPSPISRVADIGCRLRPIRYAGISDISVYPFVVKEYATYAGRYVWGGAEGTWRCK